MAHALRNASGAKRWMQCPGSLALARDAVPRQSGQAAQMGTCAHFLGEVCLREQADPQVYLGKWIKPEPEPRWSNKGEGFEIDADMAAAVRVYVDFVREALTGYQGAEMWLERRFSLNWLFGDKGVGPLGDMFGTSDCSILELFGTLHVIDYKHGAGVPVDVIDNPQLLYYALGIAQEADWAFETVKLTIVQPRAPHKDGPVRTWEVSRKGLEDFRNQLRTAAELAEKAWFAPDLGGYLHPSEEACRFCPASGFCPALKEEAIRTARADFRDVVRWSPEGLADSLNRIPMMQKFIKAVQEEALRRLMLTDSGVAEFGKLVRGVGRRSITDPEACAKYLDAKAIPLEISHEPAKLKSPAQLEKSLKAAGLSVDLSGFIQKSEGSLQYAPLDDKREAVRPDGAGDFEVYTEDDSV